MHRIFTSLIISTTRPCLLVPSAEQDVHWIRNSGIPVIRRLRNELGPLTVHVICRGYSNRREEVEQLGIFLEASDQHTSRHHEISSDQFGANDAPEHGRSDRDVQFIDELAEYLESEGEGHADVHDSPMLVESSHVSLIAVAANARVARV